MRQRKSITPLARTFAVPTMIAAASLIGLIAALLGDGAFDITSWLALAIPIVAIGWAMIRRRR